LLIDAIYLTARDTRRECLDSGADCGCESLGIKATIAAPRIKTSDFAYLRGFVEKVKGAGEKPLTVGELDEFPCGQRLVTEFP